MKLIRYADDFVAMVHGTRDDAEALRDEVGKVLAPMGLRLSEDKTRVCHIDEGFDFLGWHIQRRNWRGRIGKKAIYTYPSKKALASIIDKVRTLTRRRQHRTLADLLRPVEPDAARLVQLLPSRRVLTTFNYVDHFAFWRIVGWLRKRHVGLNMHTLVRRYLPGWRIHDRGIEMFRPYRSPSSATATGELASRHHGRAQQQSKPHQRHEHVESRMRWKSHVRFGGRAGETHRSKDDRALRPDPYTYAPTRSGMAYVCFIVDAFSRRIVGWRVASNMKTEMVLDALEMARLSRGARRLVGLITHADAGSQFTSVRFTERLAEIGARPLIGTVADSYDNALAETTNRLYKAECVRGPDAPAVWDDVDQLELATLAWVHWFNEQRLHGHCGDVPPAEFEANFYAATATPSGVL